MSESISDSDSEEEWRVITKSANESAQGSGNSSPQRQVPQIKRISNECSESDLKRVEHEGQHIQPPPIHFTGFDQTSRTMDFVAMTSGPQAYPQPPPVFQPGNQVGGFQRFSKEEHFLRTGKFPANSGARPKIPGNMKPSLADTHGRNRQHGIPPSKESSNMRSDQRHNKPLKSTYPPGLVTVSPRYSNPHKLFPTPHRDKVAYTLPTGHRLFSNIEGNNQQRSYHAKIPPPSHQQSPIGVRYVHSNERDFEVLNPRKLQEWADHPTNILLLFDMNTHTRGLCRLLKRDRLTFQEVSLLLTIFKKILNIQHQKGSLNLIIRSVCDTKFFSVHLNAFLSDLQEKKDFPNAYACLQSIVDLTEFVATNMKEQMSICARPLRTLLQVGERLNILTRDDPLMYRAQRLQQHSDFEQTDDVFLVPDSADVLPYRRNKFIPAPDEAMPPGDFSKMTLFPDTEELDTSVEPFLRANKTRGAYKDLQHYLDIHARLMKEDYLSPIRTGLQDFKKAFEQNKQPKEHDLRFYYNVQIVKISESDQGISHLITFDKTPFENIEWKYSKRLMFGSLLVFSKDNFETTIFATVANRDEAKLRRGVLEVVFQNNLEEVFTSSEWDIFIMAETTAYFESYRHVLEGLQEMRNMPLERYIISCMKELYCPHYLQHDACYDIASIIDGVYDTYSISILDDSDWPNASSTLMNDTQLKALKLALTKEMTVIQGPPGTGKTYVGLKIMRILLDNKITQQPRGRSPILVVCFTNHALDQFLEGVLDFCPDGIIRVGGRSSSEHLANFNLKELRKKNKQSGKLQRNLDNCRRMLRGINKKINRFWQESLRLESTIMNIHDLSEEMGELHASSLADSRRNESLNLHIMSSWLKASNVNVDNHLKKCAKRHLATVIAKGQETLSDVNLRDKVSVSKTDFHTRVRIYCCWLEFYKKKIEESLELLFISNYRDKERKIEQHLYDQNQAESCILPDAKLKPFMSDNVYELIKECAELENKIIENEDYFIQHWLLGKLTRAHELLDAIEKLTETRTDTQTKIGRGRPKVATEVDEYEDRWVIDDSEDDDDNSDSDESTDQSSNDEQNEIDDVDDVDDGGIIKINDIKDIQEDFQQFSNKDVVMLQRAKLLGVDLSEPQEENPEWKTAGTMSHAKVFKLYRDTKPFTAEEASQIQDLWSLKLPERYKLYKYWVQERKKKLTHRLIDLTTEYKHILQHHREVRSMRDINILKKARVIGMTTTGAARLRSVLQEVGCRIIVVEEAAEVLEAHIVTTLNKNCQHLILIGDHQQLRPNPTVYKLAVDYDLEISLFERLVRNNVPHVTLNEQHRMRPEISIYLQYIYPSLQDHFSVMSYEDIRGVCSNVFFLHHTYEESDVNDTTSRANIHEARFLVKLCKYFLQHGYQGKQITILAAYSGQVGAIRNEMAVEEDVYQFVRVTSVDNYQGEESDIVLLSLVRSNKDNHVGFLKSDNRVCVALSRAKKGLFVMGNFQLLATKSELWRAIITTAQENHVSGTFMKLVCVNHANHVTYVTNPEDFQKEVPEGGCNRPCAAPLHCGHICVRMCHATDRFHEDTKCEQPCRKVCPQGHPCQKECYQECGNCIVLVRKTVPICGHVDLVPCYLDADEFTCSQNCEDTLPCGHQCRGQCGVCRDEERHHPCLEEVEKSWPCGHINTVKCHIDVTLEPCPTACKERLECGHTCKGKCGTCLSGRVHIACKEKCKNPLPCGHPCQGPCGCLCVPCGLRCPMWCRHGPCNKQTCGELCDVCMENCALVCSHKSCQARCLDECLEAPCSKRCGKAVPKCGHTCWSLCGEQHVCYRCEKDNFSLIDTTSKRKPQYIVAHDKRERAKKFDITKDTILMKIPKCGHIFTLTQLDSHVKMVDNSTTSYIRCPTCSAPIQGISRYDTDNKRRAERRENRKENLIKCAGVPDEKINTLLASKELLHGFCQVDEGEFLSNKPGLIDSNHALALTMQIRFAYCLEKIYDIHCDLNTDTEDLKIRRQKPAIKSIQRSMPAQLEKEWNLELQRLLLLEQIVILGRLIKEANCTLSDEVKSSCRAILKDGKQKLTSELKTKAESTIKSMYDVFATAEHRPEKAEDLKHRVSAIERILSQPNTKDLSSILGKTK